MTSWWMLDRALLGLLLIATPVVAQGVEVKRAAVVLYGSATNTSQPATIDMRKVEKETPEYETIKSEGVEKGSARYEILMAKMRKRIRDAAKAAAEDASCDCVIRAGDIVDDHGLSPADLTKEVIEQLESTDQAA